MAAAAAALMPAFDLVAFLTLATSFLRLIWLLRRLRLISLLYCFPISVFTLSACYGFVDRTMKVCARQFNLYLTCFTAIMLIGGCETSKKDGKDDKNAVGAVRVHIESPRNLEGTGQTISLIRTDPVTLNIQSDPILTEASLLDVHLIDVPGGGYAIELGFNEIGTYTLEQFTAANPGRHLAIFGQWGDKLSAGRWLAAPLISRRITKGTIIFTPDASREEALKLVTGLSNIAKKNVKAISK